jgi:uncharacterized protein
VELTRLGRTNLMVTRTSFGALPLQRIERSEAVSILRKAYEAGINFYDTARGYTDSEEKLGLAFSDVRGSVVIASKMWASTRTTLLKQVEESLRDLRTDYLDVLQLHNPSALPDPGDAESSYAGLIEAKQRGMARFIGFTNHSLERTVAAIDSGLYDTVQYPLCYISSKDDLDVIETCRKADVGLIGMKPLCGGILTKLPPAFAFLRQYENLVPIWGIQRMAELEELLECDANPPQLDDSLQSIIDQDTAELADNFCRGCAYCMPCPVDIPIGMAARMGHIVRRLPYQQFLSEEWHANMMRIKNCTECGLCKSRCPYGLDIPNLLKKNLEDYEAFYQEHAASD